MQTRFVPLSLAAVLLVGVVIPAFATPAQATLTDVITQTVEGQCEPGSVLEFAQCELAPVVVEIDWIRTNEQNVATQAEAYALATEGTVVSSTTVFAGSAETVTVTFLANTETNTGAVVAYVNGQPALVGTFSLAAVDGECSFWLGNPCIPNPGPDAAARSRSDSGGIGQLQCLGGEIGVIECAVRDIAFAIADHSFDVADAADAFASGDVNAGVASTNGVVASEESSALVFEAGAVSATNGYASALRGVANGAGGEANYVVAAECAIVVGDCGLVTL